MSSIINVGQLSAKNETLKLVDTTKLNNSNTNSYIGIPGGLESQRGTLPSKPGAIRFSDEANNIEVFDGFAWRPVKNVTDYLTINFSSLALNLSSINPDSYPGTGSKWYNASTNPEFLTLYSNYTYNTGIDAHFNFDGTSYGLFEIPLSVNGDASYAAPLNSLTQEVWFRVPSNTFANENVFANFQFGIGANKSSRISLTTTGWSAGVNILGTFESVVVPFASQPLSSNTWYNFIHSYSSTNRSVSFDASASNGSSVLTFVSDLTELYIGQQIFGAGLPDVDPADPLTFTIIQNIDYENKTITLNQLLQSSDDERPFTALYPAGNYLYLNGDLIGYSAVSGSIDYDLENNLYLTIGSAYEGPGNNTGLTKYFNGDLSVYRLYGNFYTIKNTLKNFNAVKARYGY